MANDLERAASELYQADREDFIPLRKRLAKQARGDGDRELAEQIDKLAKPTTAAWLANRLARIRTAAVQELVELGDRMRDATERLAGEELRALSQRRPRLIRALISSAAEVSDQPLSDAVRRELEEILTAAVTDVDTGRALLVGRLTSAREAAPLGAWPDVLPGARQPVGVDAKAGRVDLPQSGEVRPDDAAIKEDARHSAARDALHQARDAVKEAEAARSEQERDLHEAEAEAAAASAEVLRLTEELDAAEGRERDARKRVVAARRGVKDAERAASQAWRDVQLAERRL